MMLDESVEEHKRNGTPDRKFGGPRSQRNEIALGTRQGKAEHESGQDAHNHERIACLETIIAILIEKNEGIRQQLARYQG